MRNPCQLGLACPHRGYDEDGFDCCLHPHTPETIRENDLAGYVEDVFCPLVEPDTELMELLSIPDEYPPNEWRELMRRLAVHLDRPYADSCMRQTILRRAAQEAWDYYIGLGESP